MKKKTKSKTSKRVLIFCFIFLTLYTITQLTFNALGITEYSTLTNMVFSVIGVEFGALAFVKVAKIKKGE